MAQSALDQSHQLRDIEWFIKNRIDIGLCQVCGNLMSRKAKYSEDVAEHFSHAKKGTGCPTIPKNRKKYVDLPASGYDSQNALQIKQAVNANLLSIYYKANYLADGAIGTKQFLELLSKANEKRAWEFVGLRLEFVPYLLVCLYDGEYEAKRFNKVRNAYVNAKFFIALEPGVRHIDDLWIKPTQIKQKIWRIFPAQQLIEELDIDSSVFDKPLWFDSFSKKAAFTLGL